MKTGINIGKGRMEMTNEEVIRILERKTTIPGDGYTWEQINEAIELAIVALRAGGNDMNVPTMPAGQPLTLEQLRGMDGQPVWIMESPDWGHWELSEDAEDYLAGRDTSLYGITYPAHDCKGGVHQLRWIAYAYPPAHIDREACEPCGVCNCPAYLMGANFCWHCGRPLTEEAWSELEKRLRG